MGEQGAESIHAHMMRFERVYQGIPNDVDRLKYIFKEQMLESAPSLTSLRPKPKRRKKIMKRTIRVAISLIINMSTLTSFYMGKKICSMLDNISLILKLVDQAPH